MKKKLWLLFASPLLFAIPRTSGLEVQSSVSHYYDSRSVFTNPSALSYQTLLNHARLTSSFAYGYNDNAPGDLAFSLAYGVIGIGVEKFSVLQDPCIRYSLASGIPLGKSIFFGGRYSFTNPENDRLKIIHSLDLGLQIRLSSLFSFGLVANNLNRPIVNQVQNPVQLIAGLTFMPHKRFMIQGDIESSDENFGKNLGYNVNAQLEILKGVYLSGGYHHQYQYQMGLKINVNRLALFSTVEPASAEKKVVVGIQTMPASPRSLSFLPKTLHLVLDSNLSDEGRDSTLFSEGSPSLLGLLEKMREAETDPSIREVTLELLNFPLGLASAEELTEGVLRLRYAGKKITAIFGNADTKIFLIASAASEIIMDPDGELKIFGPRAEHFYAKGFLDKIGVEAQFLAKGEYKSFPETFTRKESSEASKKATLDQIQKMEEEILALLQRTRKVSKNTWQEVINTVVLTARDAKKLGLVDNIEKRRVAVERVHRAHLVSEGEPYYRNQLVLPSKIAVITAEGNIMQSRKRSLSLLGEDQITPHKLEEAFKWAVADPSTRAIVLRVVSPGGEILPSSAIASLIEKTKKELPVYISMGDVAASGGYMISAPATRIFSDRLTYTGSIGVFLGKVSLEGLYKKLEINKEIVGRSAYAGIYSEAKSWNPEEKKIMTKLLDSYYGNFVSFVGEQRKLTSEAAEAAAKGRVWLGTDAKKLNLVDEMGGLRETIEYAAKNHISNGDYEVWEIRTPPSLLASIGLENPFGLSLGETLLGSKTYRDLYWIASIQENPFLYFSPQAIF